MVTREQWQLISSFLKYMETLQEQLLEASIEAFDLDINEHLRKQEIWANVEGLMEDAASRLLQVRKYINKIEVEPWESKPALGDVYSRPVNKDSLDRMESINDFTSGDPLDELRVAENDGINDDFPIKEDDPVIKGSVGAPIPAGASYGGSS